MKKTSSVRKNKRTVVSKKVLFGITETSLSKKVIEQTKPILSMEPVFYLTAGLVLLIFAFLTGTTNARWYIPIDWELPQVNFGICLAMGFFVLIFGFWYTKAEVAAKDISPIISWVLLGSFLTIAAGIRLYHMNIPIGLWWWDQQIGVACEQADAFSHHVSLMSEAGDRPPAFALIATFIISQFHHLSAPEVLRISSTFYEILTMIIYYLLGREVGGRRIGLLLVAIAVISREMLFKAFSGFDAAGPFFTSIAILGLLRLLHKPSLWRFIQWGILSAAGLYATPAHRPWLLFVLIYVPVWVLFQSQERRWGLWHYGVVILGPAVWLLWFLRAGGLIPANSFLAAASSNSIYWVVAFLALLCAMRIAIGFKKIEGSGRFTLGLALGLLVMAGMFYPFSINPLFSQRTGEIIDLKPLLNPLAFIHFLWNQGSILFQNFFIDGQDRPTVGPDHVTFFSLHATIFIFLGFAWTIVKPTKEKILILLSVIPGYLPWIVTTGAHTARIMAVIPPMLLIGSIGLERFWSVFANRVSPLTKVLGFLLLFVFWIWSGIANFQALWAWQEIPGDSVIIVRQAVEETKQNRVYIAPSNCAYQFMDMLTGENNIYRLSEKNAISITSDEKKPSVVVICAAEDQIHAEILRKQFPKAEWDPVTDRPPSHLGIPYLWKVRIPSEEISRDSRKIIFVQPVPADSWTRKFYESQYGMGEGIIMAEDRVLSPHAAFPSDIPGYVTTRFEKKLNAENSGTYVFSIETRQWARLTLVINGMKKEIFDLSPASGKEEKKIRKSIYLEKGLYQVEFCCAPLDAREVPQVVVQTASGSRIEW